MTNSRAPRLTRLPFGERHLVDVAGDPRTYLHGLHRLKPAGEFVPVLDALLQYLRDADLRRRRRLGAARFPAAGENQ